MPQKYDGLRRKLREYKENHNISYFDVSLDIGCSYTTISKFIKGKELSKNCLEKISHFFEEPITVFERIKMMDLDEMTGFMLDFVKFTSHKVDYRDVKNKLLERVKRRKYVCKSQ